MKDITTAPHLNVLKNRIDLISVPFSDRGSRLLVFKYPDQDRLYVKLAKRLTQVQPGLEVYLLRPPFIWDLRFTDEEGMPLNYHLTTFPHALFFQTRLGTFTLVFQKADTLAVGLPPDVTAGVCFRVSTQMWQQDDDGGSLKTVGNLVYRSNGRVLKNELGLEQEAYTVDLVVEGGPDVAIYLNIRGDLDLNCELTPFSETLAAPKRVNRRPLRPMPLDGRRPSLLI